MNRLAVEDDLLLLWERLFPFLSTTVFLLRNRLRRKTQGPQPKHYPHRRHGR